MLPPDDAVEAKRRDWRARAWRFFHEMPAVQALSYDRARARHARLVASGTCVCGLSFWCPIHGWNRGSAMGWSEQEWSEQEYRERVLAVVVAAARATLSECERDEGGPEPSVLDGVAVVVDALSSLTEKNVSEFRA